MASVSVLACPAVQSLGGCAPPSGSGGRRCHAGQRLLVDDRVDHHCGDAEHHAGPPHAVIGTDRVVEIAAEPHAGEAAELMAEEDHAEQGGHVAYPEHLGDDAGGQRSEEHTSELQSLMRISYAVFCLKKKKTTQ